MVISNKEINFSVLFWYCWYFCAGTGGQWIPPPPILSFLIFLEQNFGKYRFVLPVLPGIGTIWGALLGCKTTMARRAHCVPLDCGPQEGRLSCDSWDLALPGTLLTCFRLIVKEQLARGSPPGFLGGTSGKEPTCRRRDTLRDADWSLGWEDPLEKGMATHSSILAWRIPWTEPGVLPSIRLQRVGHDWSDSASTHAVLI